MIKSLVALVLLVCASLASAQDNTPPTVKLLLPKQAKPGAKVRAVVEITFAEGLHAYQNPSQEDYQIPTKVELGSKGFVLAKPQYPKGVMRAIGGDPKETAVYEGTVRVPIVLTAPKKGGTAEVRIVVSYQQCNESACFPPATVAASAKIAIKK